MDNKKRLRIIGVLLVSLSIFIFLSLIFFLSSKHSIVTTEEIEHKMGFAGGWVSSFLFEKTIGYACFVFPILILFPILIPLLPGSFS